MFILYRFSTIILCFSLAELSRASLEIGPSTEIYHVEERAGHAMREFSCLQPSSSSREPTGSTRHWLKDGQALVEQPDDRIVVERDGVMEQQPRLAITQDALLFRALRLEDSAVYDCIMTLGSAESDQVILSRYRLTVRDAPNPPGTPMAQLVSSRNITLIWQGAIPLNTPIQHYLVMVEPQVDKFYVGVHDVFSLEPSGGSDPADRSEEQRSRQRRIRTPDNATSFTVTNLFPFTTYTFQVIAVSEAGNSRPSPKSEMMQTKTEPPSAPPVLIVAKSPSSSSIRLQWLPPSQYELHGALRGYRLCYRKSGNETTDEIILDTPLEQTYEIRKLTPGQRYYISVQAFNEDGYSPAYTEVVSTQEAEPSAPRNLLLESVTSTAVNLTWLPPAQFNAAALLGYKIHYTDPAGVTDTKIYGKFTPAPNHDDSDSGSVRGRVHYQLIDLQPYKSYHIRVTAFTTKGEGPSSASSINILTDVAQPGSPQILNVSRVAENALLVEWTAPPAKKIFRQLDYYYVQYAAVNERGQVSNFHQLLHLPTGTAYPDGTRTRALGDEITRFPLEQAVITNLTTNHIYHIQVSAATRSIIDTDKVFRGEPSLTFSVDMDSPTTGGEAKPIALDAELSLMQMVIIIIVLLLIGLSAIGCGLFCALRKRYCLATYTYLAPNSPKCDEKLNGFARSPTMEKTYLSSTELPNHIKKLYADGQIGLSKEFESLATMLQSGDFCSSLKEAQRLENRPKNRYVNVLAYDHSRVKLKHVWDCEADHTTNSEDGVDCGCSPRNQANTPKTPVFDYINANFVDSFDMPAAYIVTQAPMTNTLVDFWSMVWDYKVRVIIMLTNLEENGRKKCEQYWPTFEEGTKRYGPYSVALVNESTTAVYIVRNFCLTSVSKTANGSINDGAGDEGKSEVRHVIQYLYSDWPDHGRPDMTVPLLRFVMKSSRSFEDESAGPPIVHCSAGVGRSGCYIALHSMMLQLDRTGHVDVFQYLLSSRKQRMALCQNESQYALIYDALLEYVQSDQTEVYVATFDEYVDGLAKDNGLGFRQQHALINCDTAGPDTSATFEYANEPYNKPKNRSPQFLPTDVYSHRVSISMKPGVPGSDYINASFLPSYRHLKQFIITQYPLEETISAFWQMIWDHRVRQVVILDSSQMVDNEPTQLVANPSFIPFWPSASTQTQVYETFQISLDKDLPHSSGALSSTEWCLTPLNEREDCPTFTCRILQMAGETSANSGQALMEIFQQFEDAKLDESLPVGKRGSPVTVVVMDEFGGASAALFCGLMTIRQQAMAEGSVDVYQTARLYNLARPGVFSSLEAYTRFYQAGKSVCQQVAECFPIEQFCFTGTVLHPSSAAHILNASKRLSAILEQEE